MEFSFRGPPNFWEHIRDMADAALRGETVFCGNTTKNDPGSTENWRITFVGDPEGDGIGLLFIPDENGRNDSSAWLELSDRVADASP